MQGDEKILFRQHALHMSPRSCPTWIFLNFVQSLLQAQPLPVEDGAEPLLLLHLLALTQMQTISQCSHTPAAVTCRCILYQTFSLHMAGSLAETLVRVVVSLDYWLFSTAKDTYSVMPGERHAKCSKHHLPVVTDTPDSHAELS